MVTISLATEQDASTVAIFSNNVLAHHAEFDSFYQPVATAAEKPAEVEKFAFVARLDDTSAVGYVEGVFHPQPLDRSVPYAVIRSLWVEEAARGQGIAQQLVDKFEQTVVAKGAKQIDMFVDVRNHVGLAFWDNAGYETYQQKRRKLIS